MARAEVWPAPRSRPGPRAESPWPDVGALALQGLAERHGRRAQPPSQPGLSESRETPDRKVEPPGARASGVSAACLRALGTDRECAFGARARVRRGGRKQWGGGGR